MADPSGPATAGEELLQRAEQAAGPQGRLPLGAMASWEVFPFEADSLVVRPLSEYADPEPSRAAVPDDCKTCVAAGDPARVLGEQGRFATIWVPTSLVFVANVVTRDHVSLDSLAAGDHADLGIALGATYAALKGLDDVGQVHINKWENGKGHLAFVLMARPRGVLQLRGSNLPVWADLLPPTPTAELETRAEVVRAALAG